MTELAADGTGNGIIDEGDWVVWRQNYGESIEPGNGAATAIIPEPNAAAAVVGGDVALLSILRAASPVRLCGVFVS